MHGQRGRGGMRLGRRRHGIVLGIVLWNYLKVVTISTLPNTFEFVIAAFRSRLSQGEYIEIVGFADVI